MPGEQAAQQEGVRDCWPRATLIVFAVLGWILVDSLRWDWEVNPQYSYGWLVPFFSAYLFWKRWASRPAPVKCEAGSWRGRWRWLLLVVVLGLVLLPTRILRESSPDWAVVRWALGLEVVALMWALLGWMGGRAFALHFAWPLGFLLVAVPWPSGVELEVTQGLMQRVALVTAEVVGWMGYQANAKGNLIELSSGMVGVDEACSGVRSLQSMLMASLLLGELQRLGAVRRIVLVAAGIGFALLFNLLRSLLLVGIAIGSGLQELEKWHDSAGLGILVLSLGALLGVLRLLGGKRAAGDEAAEAGVGERGMVGLGGVGVVAALLWVAAVEAGTEAWYRTREAGRAGRMGWEVRWDRIGDALREQPISAQVRKILAYEKGRSVDFERDDGSRWRLFFFHWAPGRTSTQAARSHRPEVCLPATGRTLAGEFPAVKVRVGGKEVPFRVYEFQSAGPALHVFFCLWEEGNEDLGESGLEQEWSAKGRLQRAWMGRRNLGQQSLEVIVAGFPHLAQAQAAFEEMAGRLLVPVD